MREQKKGKSSKEATLRPYLLLISFIIIGGLFTPMPLVIGITIAEKLHSRLYPGFYLPLIVVGKITALQVFRQVSEIIFTGELIFKKGKAAPSIINIRDGIFNYFLSITVFSLIAFYPMAICRCTISAFVFSTSVGIITAILVSYLLGTDITKQKIKNFPKGFKRRRIRHKPDQIDSLDMQTKGPKS